VKKVATSRKPLVIAQIPANVSSAMPG
jgi:hypothetical protein